MSQPSELEPSQPALSMKILVAAGDSKDRDTISGSLREQGLCMVEASDAESFLDQTRQIDPSVIILDVPMQGADVFELCRSMKSDEKLRSIPVLLMVASDNVQDKVAAYRAGADDTVTKPLLSEELKARVSSFLPLSRRSLKWPYNEDLRHLVEESPELIWSVDADGCWTYMNEKATQRIYGRSSKEMIGRPFSDFMTTEQAEKDLHVFEEIKAGSNRVDYETVHLRKDGSPVVLSFSATVERDDRGELIGTVGTAVNVTKRSRSATRVLRLHELERCLLDPGCLQEKANRITSGVVDVLHADFARLWLIKPGDQCQSGCVHAEIEEGPHVCIHRDRCLHLISSSGRYTHTDSETHGRVPFGCYKIGRVAAAEELGFVTNEVTVDPRVHDHRWAKELGLVSFSGHRLQSTSGETIGVLALFCKHEISQDETTLLEVIAGISSIVVQTSLAEEALRESEQKYRGLVDRMTYGVAIHRYDGTLVYVNPASVRILGYDSMDELIGMSVTDILHEDSVKEATERIANVIGTGEAAPFIEQKLLRKNGTVVPSEISGSAITFEGRPAIQAALGDLTERKRAQEELLRLSTAVRMSSDGFVVCDLEGNITEFNDATLKMYGSEDRSELLGKSIFELFHPDEIERATEGLQEVLEQGPHQHQEYRVLRRDGSEMPVEMSSSSMVDGSGHPYAFAAIVRDISGRKLAEEEARAYIRFLESLELVNNAIRRAGDVEQLLAEVCEVAFSIFACDRAFVMVPCDPEAPSFRVPAEVTRPEYPGAMAMDIDVPMKPGSEDIARHTLASEGPATFGQEGEHPLHEVLVEQFAIQSMISMAVPVKTGEVWAFGMHQCSYPRRWTRNEHRLMIEIARRLTEALSTLLVLQDLRESEQRFRTLVDRAADAFFLTTIDGWILDVNQRTCESLGYSRDKLLSMNMIELDAEYESHCERTLGERTLVKKAFETRQKRKDGTMIPVEVSPAELELGGKRLLLSFCRDVTERRRVEDELAQYRQRLEELVKERTLQLEEVQQELLRKERLAALGQLTASVAHEIRNPLGTIRATTFVLDRRLRGKDLGIEEDLERARRSVMRCDRIIEELLDYTRNKPVETKLIELENSVSRIVAEHDIPDGIEVVKQLSPGIKASLDVERFRRCMINVLANACHAMEAELDQKRVLTIESRRVGDRAEVRVTDTGIGINEKDMKRVFEPLFSTKSFGVGLGLCIVKQIMEQHGGGIELESRPGEGTTVALWVPAVGGQD